MTDIDSLVDRILVKNAAKSKSPELVVSILKSHGLDAVHVSDHTYKISRCHEWHYQAQDAVRQTKKILLNECSELHVKNVEAYAECYKSVVLFEV
jgi:hypothetical protein